MKIAQIAPVVESIPPKKYGGTERVVYALTEELVARGHEVTLFATGDSQTSARLVSVYPRGLRSDGIEDLLLTNAWSFVNIGKAYDMQHEFDIIHDHTGVLAMPTAQNAIKPTVFTLHNAFAPHNIPVFEQLSKPYLVSISRAQKTFAPQLNYARTVYNGLEMKHYTFSNLPQKYLLYVGRLVKNKGVHLAIAVAQKLKLPLIIAAKLDTTYTPYFEQYIKPHLSSQIRWIGEVAEDERNILMSRALCFLHPVQWPEPFGLTLIEAMACGCPVIAFNKGSIPEVIQNGKTGYVVENVEEMADAVKKIHRIDRYTCRSYSLSNFGAVRMTDKYEELYLDMVHQHTYLPRHMREEGRYLNTVHKNKFTHI